MYVILFFFNDTATTEIYTLSLHDALPICVDRHRSQPPNSTAWARFCSTRRTVLLPPSSSSSIQTSSTRADSCTSETWEIMKICPKDRLRRSRARDRKSTRLNSSHANISYAVFCLKKKNNQTT